MRKERWKLLLMLLLDTIIHGEKGFDQAFRTIVRKYDIDHRESRALYKIGFNLVNYYHTTRFLLSYQGKKPTIRNIVEYYSSRLFNVETVREEAEEASRGLGAPVRLAFLYSYPLWIVKELLEHMPVKEVEEMLSSLNKKKRYLRVTGDVDRAVKCLEEEGIAARLVADTNDLLEVVSDVFQPVGSTTCYKRGLIIPEDISSYLTARVISRNLFETMLDACSAPGMKLLHLYHTNAFTRSIAVDYSLKRIRALGKLVASKTGSTPRIILVNADSTLVDYSQRLDFCLVDAPCSGTGAVYGDPSVKIRISRSELRKYIGLQEKLLYKMLENCQKIAYVVCSILPGEGEERVEELARRKDILLRKPDHPHISQGYRGYGISGRVGRIMPHVVNGQGFFISIIEVVGGKRWGYL